MKNPFELPLPQGVRRVITELNKHHFDAFLVGGCVRDSLLHRSVHDYDITTNALPTQVIEVFSSICPIIKHAIRHGTLTLLLDEMAIEVTTYRIEWEYLNHRSPKQIAFTDDLRRDLARRDFTINAMAMHPALGIIDPFGGQQDLQARCIRCVNDADTRLEEDALRILRAVRFACTLNFTLDDSLVRAIKRKADLLTCLSKERIRDELIRILESERKGLLQMLKELRLLVHLFPAVEVLIDLPQETPWHCCDVFTHTDHALDHSISAPLCERLALVYHDCGKVFTKTYDAEGIAHFKGHAEYSAQIAKTALTTLAFDKTTIQTVVSLIRFHDVRVDANPRSLRRFLSMLDYDYALAQAILRVQRADNLAKNQTKAAKSLADITQAERLLTQMQQKNERFTLKELAIGGNDLRSLGLRGKAIGDLLHRALAWVIDDPSRNERAQLIAYVQHQCQSQEEDAIE